MVRNETSRIPESCNVLIVDDFNHIHKGIVCIWIEDPQIQLEYLISLVLQVNEQLFTAATISDFAKYLLQFDVLRVTNNSGVH